jgi:MarC family membrane protein
MEQSFLSAFILILLVTDPLGNVPNFIAVLRTVPPERRRRVVLREVFAAYVLLLAFMFFGEAILHALHLTQPALGIAGGVILFLIALRMIFPPADGIFGAAGAGEPFIVPLAVPLVAGPSALATVILIASQAPGRMGEWIGALTAALAVSAVVLSFADTIRRLLGEKLTTAVERLMGLILTAMAVEMLLNGVRGFVRSL